MSDTLFGPVPLASTVVAPVMAATAWADNAQLILDCVRLGYLAGEDEVVDLTYGLGNWWNRWSPAFLWRNDLDPAKGVESCDDFRSTSLPSDCADAVAFDPPYIAQGGRDTSTTQEFIRRFGLVEVPKTPPDVQQLINDGLTEAHRIVKPGGVVLVKCKDYVNGGKVWWGTYETHKHAAELGLFVEDRLEHLSGTGPQPPRDRQLHARRNLSTLFVFRKPVERLTKWVCPDHLEAQ